ncbi:hypothetical protein D3C81_971690 [compost metagenome]
MLLADTNIKNAVRHLLFHCRQPAAGKHSWAYSDNTAIMLGELYQRFAEHLLKSLLVELR